MLISLVFFVVPSIYLFRPNVFNQTRYIPSLYIRESRESSRADSSDYCFKEMTDFKAAVKRQVGPDGMILLPSSVDRGYLKMALNFYETSIVRNNIKNVLMICSDRQACIELWKRCIPAFLYVEDEAGGEAQEFLSTDFIRKSRRKIYWIQVTNLTFPSRHKTLNQCWFNAGPASHITTLTLTTLNYFCKNYGDQRFFSI